MAIPDFQSIMLPLMRHLQDDREHPTGETLDALAKHFELTEEDRRVRLPSGVQEVFTNRVAWAKSHLKKAGLLANPKRGVYQITARGRDVLADPPTAINLRFLYRFPEYKAFRALHRQRAEEPEEAEANHIGTPEEALETAHAKTQENLAADLLQQLKACSPHFFERLVVEVIVKMGYGGSRHDAGRAIGKSGDGGIDGIIKEDKLGLDAIYIQAKRWQGTVGRPEIQKFVGALHGQRARKGVFMTTSGFSPDARDYVSHIDVKVVLLDGMQIANLMIDTGVGVTPVATYVVKRLDSDYFEEA